MGAIFRGKNATRDRFGGCLLTAVRDLLPYGQEILDVVRGDNHV